LPLIFRPVALGNTLLADGGLSAPVPVDVARNMGADLIIAVNLDADYFGDGKDVSSNFGFYKIADNSINLLRHHLAQWNIKDADLVIDPRAGNTSWNKFLDGKSIISDGEEAMRQALPQLKKLLEQKKERWPYENTWIFGRDNRKLSGYSWYI